MPPLNAVAGVRNDGLVAVAAVGATVHACSTCLMGPGPVSIARRSTVNNNPAQCPIRGEAAASPTAKKKIPGAGYIIFTASWMITGTGTGSVSYNSNTRS